MQIEDKLEQPLNADAPIVVRFLGRLMDFKFEYPEKTRFPRIVTSSGIEYVIGVFELEPGEKAIRVPSLIKHFPSLLAYLPENFKFGHNLKHSSPIVIVLSGMVIEDRLVHPPNALTPIVVIPS